MGQGVGRREEREQVERRTVSKGQGEDPEKRESGGGDTGREDGGEVTVGGGETNAEEKEKRSKVEEKGEKEGCEREARVDTGGSMVKEEEKGTGRREGGDR